MNDEAIEEALAITKDITDRAKMMNLGLAKYTVEHIDLIVAELEALRRV